MSLRQKILVSSALIVVPLAVLGIGAYLIARASLVDEANQQVRIEAEFRAAEISRRLDIAQDELQAIAEWSGLTLPAVEGRLAQDAGVFAEPIAAVSTWWEHFDGFAIVHQDGTVVGGPSLWPQGEPTPPVGVGGGPWSVLLSSESIQLTQRLADSDLFVQALVPADFVFAGPVPEAEAIDSGSIGATAEIPELGNTVVVSRSESSVVGALRPLLWLVVATVAVALIVAMATAWWLARHVLRRLAVLTRTTDAMHEGDWTARTGDLGSDELGRLGLSLDRMADGVESEQLRRRQIEDELAHQALHDPLTGLANRAKFLDRLGDALARSGRSGAPVAVLFCDLDNLKIVNDEFGHQAGDDLLTGIAERFRASIRPSDTVARFGGDEFVVLCAEMAAPEDAAVVADRLIRSLARPFQIHGQPVDASVSVGVAVGSGATSRADELLADADAAMYTAKRTGKGRFVLHAESLDDRIARRERDELEAKRAIDTSELVLLFQPMLEATTGKLLAVEALVRWKHPDRGLLAPQAFLPQFADAGLMADLDSWVIDRVAAQIDHWNSVRPTGPPLRVSINLSRSMLRLTELQQVVDKAVSEHRIEPHQLLFEVPESILSADPMTAVAALDALRTVGVGLVIDEFGLGHTSVERLRRYGLELVKFDGSLLGDQVSIEAGNTEAKVAVNRILSMSAELGIETVAVGVEHMAQVPELIDLGCRYIQGRLLCGPLDGVSVLRWIEQMGER